MNQVTTMLGFDKTDIKRLVVLGVLLLWCTTMIAVRMDRTGTAIAVLLEQCHCLLRGAVVLALVVDREHEIAVAIEIASTG